jgi:hypothetical protein
MVADALRARAWPTAMSPLGKASAARDAWVKRARVLRTGRGKLGDQGRDDPRNLDLAENRRPTVGGALAYLSLARVRTCAREGSLEQAARPSNQRRCYRFGASVRRRRAAASTPPDAEPVGQRTMISTKPDPLVGVPSTQAPDSALVGPHGVSRSVRLGRMGRTYGHGAGRGSALAELKT